MPCASDMPHLDAAPRKKRRWLLLPLVLLAIPVALKLLGVQAVNQASTSADSADASLRTRLYAVPPDQVWLQVHKDIPRLSTYGQAWRMVGGQVGPSIVVACEVPVLMFTDDLTVTIAPDGSGSRVDVRSASRVGQGDFGENARHIRQLLSVLDARLHRA